MKEKNTTTLLGRVTGLFVLLFVVAFLFGVTLPELLTTEAASAPNIFSYQGRVLNTNSVPVTDSALSMKFELYDSDSGGTCVWSNSSASCDSNTPASTTARSVTLTQGLFSENLGDTGAGTPYAAIADSIFGDNAALYLQVYIGGETLTPRKMITAAPYAMNADTLDGLSSANFLQTSGSNVATSTFDLTSSTFSGASPFVFEGNSVDDFEASFTITDPTADRVITFQDGTGTVAFTSDITGGSGLFTDGGSASYLTATTDDLAVGGTGISTSAFGLDVSANLMYLGSGSTANAKITFKASDADTGDLEYTTNDRLELTGGGLSLEGVTEFTDLDGASTSADAFFLLDDGGSTSLSGSLSANRNQYGLFVFPGSSTDANGNTYKFDAIHGAAYFDGTGGANSIRGVYGKSHIAASSGTTTNGIGVYGEVRASVAGGTITNAHGVQGSVLSGDGTITTGMGGRFDNISAGTTRYGVYGEASGGTNNYAGYFASAPVHIETGSTPTTPDVATAAGELYVSGDIETDSSIRIDSGKTTGSALRIRANSLTTGEGINLTSPSSITSGSLIDVDHSATYSANATVSGNGLVINRALTIDDGGGGGETLTVTGAVLQVASSLTATSGSISDSSNIINVAHNYSAGTGDALKVTNAGTGAGLFIDQNGGTGATVNDTTGGALHISNTGNGNSAITVYSNNSAVSGPLAYLHADHASFDQSLISLKNDGTGPAQIIDQDGDTGSTINDTAGGAFHVSNTGNNGSGISVYSDNGASQNTPLQYIFADNTGFDRSALEVRNDGTGTSLKIDTDGDTKSLEIVGASGSTTNAVDIDVDTGTFAFSLFNDGNNDNREGIQIQACADTNPTGTCEYIVFEDGNGTILGAVEGDGAGGVTNASSGSDYAELFPGTLADFSEGDVLALDSSGSIVLASDAREMIGALSITPNVLGNWFDEWRAAGTYVPVGLLGQIPVNINTEGGSIAAGDYLTLSSVDGTLKKATGVGVVLGRALESHASGAGMIQVFIEPQWQAVDVLTESGGVTLVDSSLTMNASGSADASTQGVASELFAMRGSGWNGTSAEDTEMVLLTEVTDASTYRLSVRNDAADEVAYISNAGDLALAGKLYPSDRGTLQTDKYIYYDGSAGSGGNLMRTNAAGWGTGSYDFAEMFPSAQTLAAGEVVIFASDTEHVERSSGKAYDQRLAGVISTRPGFVAGENIEGHVAVALAGRVPTLVSAENGTIAIGDPLTSSSIPGYAMKATEPGPIVGYAMEVFEGDSGSIVSFIRPSYYDGGPVSEDPVAENIASEVSDILTFDTMRVDVRGGALISVGSLSGISDYWRLEQDGTLYSKGRFVEVIESHQGEDVETYATTSPDTMIQLAGTAAMKRGFVRVEFEKINEQFNDIIASSAEYRVFLTPHDPTEPLYVMERSTDGFVIKENGGETYTDVDWLVIAYHKDHAPEELPEETVQPEDSEENVEDGSSVQEEVVEESGEAGSGFAGDASVEEESEESGGDLEEDTVGAIHESSVEEEDVGDGFSVPEEEVVEIVEETVTEEEDAVEVDPSVDLPEESVTADEPASEPVDEPVSEQAEEAPEAPEVAGEVATSEGEAA